MGRGIARSAEFTKKCSCGKPSWSKAHIEVNGVTHEITYVMSCRSCGAYWASKSREYRQYWDMNEIPVVFNGYAVRYDDKRTNGERFRELDEKRLAYLECGLARREEEVIAAQKEADKARRAVEKFKSEMGFEC